MADFHLIMKHSMVNICYKYIRLFLVVIRFYSRFFRMLILC